MHHPDKFNELLAAIGFSPRKINLERRHQFQTAVQAELADTTGQIRELLFAAMMTILEQVEDCATDVGIIDHDILGVFVQGGLLYNTRRMLEMDHEELASIQLDAIFMWTGLDKFVPTEDRYELGVVQDSCLQVVGVLLRHWEAEDAEVRKQLRTKAE